MTTPSPSPWPGLLLLGVFWAALVALSLLGVEARYASGDLAALSLLHLLLAAALYFAILAGESLGRGATSRTAGFLASAGAALVLLWHARELTYRPSSLAAVVLLALLLAVPIHLFARRYARCGSLRKALLGLAASGVAVCVAVVWVFGTGGRFHLLRHNKLLGTPSYYLLAERIAEVENALFDRHRDSHGEDEEKSKAETSDDIEAKEVSETETDFFTGMDQGTTEMPHLIFILLDTLRADALEMGGGPRDAMPRLNAFLDGAYRLSDVAANASWTRPSMASMLTGLLAEEHGARDVDDPLEERFFTLAEFLRARGFETAAFVSNIGAVGRSAGFAQGYDFFHEFKAEPYARAGRIRGTLERWFEARSEQESEGKTSSERPLLLYLHFLDPHEPYLAGRAPRSKSRASYEAAYREELLYLDRELAGTIELIEARLPGPKAFFFASDHGEEFGEHEEFGHGYSLYREVIHIPVAFHTGRGSGTLDEPLEGRDLFDLLTRWAASSGTLDVATWAAEKRRDERYASIYYSSSGRLLLRPYLQKVCMRMVESAGHKLVWSAYGSTYELYRLDADPYEQRNLATMKPDLVGRLAARFDKQVERWHFPKPYERSAQESEQLRSLGYLDN